MRSILLLCLLTATAWASPVSLKVEVLGDKDTQSKGKITTTRRPERVTTDNRQLEITLNNVSGQSFPGLRVVYYLFARDVKEKEILLAKKGEKTLTLAGHGREKFVTDTAVMAYHSSSAKTVAGKVQTTPASGYKFVGYGVQVVAGDAVLVEVFDPKDLKASADLPETPTLYDEKKWKKKWN